MGKVKSIQKIITSVLALFLGAEAFAGTRRCYVQSRNEKREYAEVLNQVQIARGGQNQALFYLSLSMEWLLQSKELI